MTSTLYLIRHGESDMNTKGHLIGGRSNETPLTNRGIEQATRLGKYLLSHDIIPTSVFASPAVRTQQTATVTLAAMEIATDPNIDDALQEMDQGDYVGRERSGVYTPAVLAEIEEHGKDFKLRGGESMNEVGGRMLEWIETSVPTATEPIDSAIFVFGHGIAIKSLISLLEGWTQQHTVDAVLDNTSVTVLTDQSGVWKLQSLGSTAHLDNTSNS